MTYILAQICAILSTAILLVYSVLKVDRKVIVFCNVVINALLTAHYLLLDDYVGAVCTAICTTMVFVFYFKHSSRFLSRTYIPVFFALLLIVCAVCTWTDAWSIIPLIGNLILVYALWNDKSDTIKALFIIVGVLWIVYNIHLHSIANIIGQCLAVTCNCIYFFRVRRK